MKKDTSFNASEQTHPLPPSLPPHPSPTLPNKHTPFFPPLFAACLPLLTLLILAALLLHFSSLPSVLSPSPPPSRSLPLPWLPARSSPLLPLPPIIDHLFPSPLLPTRSSRTAYAGCLLRAAPSTRPRMQSRACSCSPFTCRCWAGQSGRLAHACLF